MSWVYLVLMSTLWKTQQRNRIKQKNSISCNSNFLRERRTECVRLKMEDFKGVWTKRLMYPVSAFFFSNRSAFADLLRTFAGSSDRSSRSAFAGLSNRSGHSVRIFVCRRDDCTRIKFYNHLIVNLNACLRLANSCVELTEITWRTILPGHCSLLQFENTRRQGMGSNRTLVKSNCSISTLSSRRYQGLGFTPEFML